MEASFAKRIALMNSMYRLPANQTQTLPADVADRLQKFKKTLSAASGPMIVRDATDSTRRRFGGLASVLSPKPGRMRWNYGLVKPRSTTRTQREIAQLLYEFLSQTS